MRGRWVVVMAVVMASVAAWAGQPWYGGASGAPYHWKDGVVTWVGDPGGLAQGCDNACAIAMVQKAFGVWAAAGLQNPAAGGFMTTVNLHPSLKELLPEDVVAEKDKQGQLFYPSVLLDLSKPATIVFDSDAKAVTSATNNKNGEILTAACKKINCDPDKVIALTIVDGGYDLDDKAGIITHGVTILDGAKYNRSDIGPARFYASVVHEIGHLLGLDHSGLNDTYAVNKDRSKPSDVAGAEKGIPTMYPANVSDDQATLHTDDVVAISSLYPADALFSQFCTIEGRIVDSKGAGIQGVEVVAWAEPPANTLADSMSTMTGVAYPVPTQDGHYKIQGVVPKRVYAVTFGSLPLFSSDGSGIGMFSSDSVTAPILGKPPRANAPEGICFKGTDSCQITAAQGTVKDVSCDKGGQTINMDVVTLDTVTIDAHYATAPAPIVNEPPPTPAAAASGKSGCTLIR